MTDHAAENYKRQKTLGESVQGLILYERSPKVTSNVVCSGCIVIMNRKTKTSPKLQKKKKKKGINFTQQGVKLIEYVKATSYL